MNKSVFEKNGADWYADRYNALRVERNRYFTLLIICFIALVVSITAILMLTPLKTAVPYVIEVNKNDGMTSIVKPITSNEMKKNKTLTLYFLYKYLYARMNYDYGLRQIQAETVRLLSAASVFQAYAKEIDVANPLSPIRLYQNHSTVNTQIISYSFPYPDIAQIHFYTENIINDNNNTPSSRRYWQATIKFTFADTSLPIEQRINTNPVGFFVTDFQLNSEIATGGQP